MRALKFGAVGLVNTAVDVSLFALLTTAAGAAAVTANVVSYSAGIMTSFVLNRAWTFSDRGGAVRTQLPLFVVGSLAGLAISTATVGLLAGVLPVLAAKLVSVIATFAWNYVFASLLVFRGRD